MKIVLIRIGALITVVVLGWIAMAQAQRGGNTPEEQPATAAATAGDSNPLRSPGSQTKPPRPARHKTSRPGRRRRTIRLGSRNDLLRRPGASANPAGGGSTAAGNRGRNAGASADVHIVPASHGQDATPLPVRR